MSRLYLCTCIGFASCCRQSTASDCQATCSLPTLHHPHSCQCPTGTTGHLKQPLTTGHGFPCSHLCQGIRKGRCVSLTVLTVPSPLYPHLCTLTSVLSPLYSHLCPTDIQLSSERLKGSSSRQTLEDGRIQTAARSVSTHHYCVSTTDLCPPVCRS